VLDEFMLELMYELPDHDNTGVTYVIEPQLVGTRPHLKDLGRVEAKESA
jgi:hypothetical protein